MSDKEKVSGEAVEVVGYFEEGIMFSPYGDPLHDSKLSGQDLMTVAQHQRITEALRGEVADQYEYTITALESERDQLRAEVDWLKAINCALDESNKRLLAQQQVPVVPGWKLVPVEPTPEMLHAADAEHGARGLVSIALISYRAMLAVAPAPVQAELASPWVADTEAAIQLAFELGGLEDGSYHLEADELERVLRAALPPAPEVV